MMRRLVMLVTVAVLGLLYCDVPAQAAEPFRIGLLGIDNFGSVAYTEFFNRPHPARVHHAQQSHFQMQPGKQ